MKDPRETIKAFIDEGWKEENYIDWCKLELTIRLVLRNAGKGDIDSDECLYYIDEAVAAFTKRGRAMLESTMRGQDEEETE